MVMILEVDHLGLFAKRFDGALQVPCLKEAAIVWPPVEGEYASHWLFAVKGGFQRMSPG
jgi:hypothetical protein